MASIANWDSHYQRVTVSFCPPMYVFFFGGEELGIMGWSNGIPYNTSTVTVTFSGGEVDIMGWANGLCPQFTAFWNMNDWILGYSAHLQMIYLPIESGDCSYCFISMLNYQRVDRPWRGWNLHESNLATHTQILVIFARQVIVSRINGVSVFASEIHVENSISGYLDASWRRIEIQLSSMMIRLSNHDWWYDWIIGWLLWVLGYCHFNHDPIIDNESNYHYNPTKTDDSWIIGMESPTRSFSPTCSSWHQDPATGLTGLPIWFGTTLVSKKPRE